MDLEELKEHARLRGFFVTMLDRGANFRRISCADRFEIWLEGRRFNSKVSFCGTLQEAVDEALPEINEMMEIFKPGRFRD